MNFLLLFFRINKGIYKFRLQPYQLRGVLPALAAQPFGEGETCGSSSELWLLHLQVSGAGSLERVSQFLWGPTALENSGDLFYQCLVPLPSQQILPL